MLFHPIILFENGLICILITINELLKMRENRGKTIYYHRGGGNKTYPAHLGQYFMGVKLFSETIFMRSNMIITVKIKTFESFKIAWFPWQPIMQYLRMGAYLQNTHI